MLIYIRVALILLCCVYITGRATASPIDEIRNSWAELHKEVQSGTFEWEEEFTIMKGRADIDTLVKPAKDLSLDYPPSDITMHRKCSLAVEGTKRAWRTTGDFWSSGLAKVSAATYVSIFDGEKGISYNEGPEFDGLQWASYTKEFSDSTEINLLAIEWSIKGPWKAIQSSDASQWTVREGKLGGKRCQIAQMRAPGITRVFWCDPQSSHRILRYDVSEKGIPALEISIEYRDHGKGVKVPSQWSYTLYTADGTIDNMLKARVTSARINEGVAAGSFEIELPARTVLLDDRDGSVKVVMPDGDLRVVTDAEMAAGTSFQEILDGGEPPQGIWRWPVFGLAAIVICVGAWYVCRRYRARRLN